MRTWFLVALIFCGFLLAGCGGGDEEAEVPQPEPAQAPETTTPAGGATGEGTVGAGQAEALRDVPFTLNTDQVVPPDFRAAYQRNALIAVEFIKLGQDPFYPQGLEVDNIVSSAFADLSGEYPTIEFFSYDIDDPGSAEVSENLEQGQYGTLAAQLGVGYTPFVATLAPTGNGYVVQSLYQGYVPQPVLAQALADLANTDVEGNTSDLDVTLQRVELTEQGGGIEYFTVQNRTNRAVSLQGFSVRALDPETGEVNPDSPGVMVNERIRVGPGESASIGRVPDVVDADGQQVVGTFEGGQALDLVPGDQLALLDSGGAVASTATI